MATAHLQKPFMFEIFFLNKEFFSHIIYLLFMYQSSILYYETIYFSKFEIFLPLITHNL